MNEEIGNTIKYICFYSKHSKNFHSDVNDWLNRISEKIEIINVSTAVSDGQSPHFILHIFYKVVG